MKNWKKLTALLLVGMMTTSILTGCGEKTSESEQSLDTAETSVVETDVTESEEMTMTTTVHVSPTETVTSTLGTEISDIDALLDRDATNSYNAKLCDFSLEEGDVIQSFTFIVYAEDGTSSLSSYQGGYGISVSEDCAAATDDCWYQSDDFTESVNSAYAEFTWTVPTEIQEDIDINGEVLFGHWWSGVQTVRLSSIVCTFTRTKDVPVDGTNSISPDTILQYGSDTEKSTNIALSDLIGSDDTLQTVTFSISSSGSLGKFTGAFGISVEEEASCATDDCWYQTQNICVITDASSLTLVWILPDDVKESVDANGEVMFGFWWSDQESVTLDSVSVRYSNSTGTTTQTETTSGGEVSSVSSEIPTSDEVNAMTSAEIVEQIRVGWNLGNSLESYDTSSDDTEIGWGNPKTTKAMMEAVQDAGFNAVRIPVTWGEHMSEDGTIDADWMARVQEVVDYAYDCGLYVILNVHHDDYLWLTPTSDAFENDKAVLTNIWTQICETFSDYDHRLIFEGMNEPRVIGSAEEWTGGTAESQEIVNQLYQAFVDTVRESGGLNEQRTLIVSSYAQSIEKTAVEALDVPDDAYVVVSFHSYAPWDFCGDESEDADWGTDADKTELDANFQYLYDTFISQGIPVIIDEFGAVNKNNTEAREDWYSYYVRTAKSYGIKCFVWDNGTVTGDSSFGLFDRETCTWYYPEIVEAIINAAN